MTHARRALELVVDTRFDHLDIAAPRPGGDSGRRPIPKRQVVVFELDRPVGFEPVFEPSTGQPAAVRARSGPARAVGEVQRGDVPGPAATHLSVGQPSVERKSKTGRDRTDPILLGGEQDRAHRSWNR